MRITGDGGEQLIDALGLGRSPAGGLPAGGKGDAYQSEQGVFRVVLLVAIQKVGEAFFKFVRVHIHHLNGYNTIASDKIQHNMVYKG